MDIWNIAKKKWMAAFFQFFPIVPWDIFFWL